MKEYLKLTTYAVSFSISFISVYHPPLFRNREIFYSFAGIKKHIDFHETIHSI